MKINKSMLLLTLLAAFAAPLSALSPQGDIQQRQKAVNPAFNQAGTVSPMSQATLELVASQKMATTAKANLINATAALNNAPESPIAIARVRSAKANVHSALDNLTERIKAVRDAISNTPSSQKMASGLKPANEEIAVANKIASSLRVHSNEATTALKK